MAEEIVASPTALANGDNEAKDKEFADAVAIAVEEEEASVKDAAAASGDRDAAVELLIEEIRDLKKARTSLHLELSDARAKLAGTESELKAVAGQASRLEGELRIVHDDLATANMVASEHEEEICRLQVVIKDLEAKLKIKANEHETKVRDLAEGLRVSEQKVQDKDNTLRAKDFELEELRSQIVDEKEKSLRNSDMQGGAGASLTQSRVLGTASAVGVAALAIGTLVCLYLAKRK